MTRTVDKGAVDVTEYVFVPDSSASDGSGLTGLTDATSGLTAYYVRQGDTATAITLASQTVGGAHTDGGFVEVDATNMPGIYRVDLPDAMFATGADVVILMLRGATNMAPVSMRFDLTDPIDADNPIQADVVSAKGVITGAAATGTLTTGSMTTDLSEATDDHYNNRTVVFTSGALTGQSREISDYAGTGGEITFASALTEAPSDGDEFIIV